MYCIIDEENRVVFGTKKYLFRRRALKAMRKLVKKTLLVYDVQRVVQEKVSYMSQMSNI